MAKTKWKAPPHQKTLVVINLQQIEGVSEWFEAKNATESLSPRVNMCTFLGIV